MIQSDNTEQTSTATTSDQTFHEVDLQRQAWELLEFTNVRELLAERTRFFMSREMALEARPLVHLEDVKRLQDETSQAVLMLSTVGDIGLAGSRDPRGILRRAAIDGLLNGEEIVSVMFLIDSIRVAQETVMSMKGRTPLLEGIAKDIPDLRDLSKEVFKFVSDQGEILSSATPKLARLRANVSKTFQRVMRAMERIANSSSTRQSLQSNAIATRGDRLVLEVRTDARDSIQGIVHDVSSSGSTLFVEPLKVVDLCNDWRETVAETHREEERILRRISRLIGDRETEALIAIEAAAALDYITARARLADSMKARRVKTMPTGSDNVINLMSARHPLLGDHAIPITVKIGPEFRGLVITGPNTGGKTVAIKTIGLFALMHQSGMHLPIQDGELAIFDSIFADIGDNQSIERSVSTFSSHMGRVIKILLEATPNSLILLDELGTGTDPEEGSALARSVLAHAVENSIPIAITSHYRNVAEYAAESEELANASVELDPTTMLPTYQVLMGIPGRSYAIHVARQLGMPNHVLDKAQSMMDPSHTEAENMLDQLHSERDEINRMRDETHSAKIKAETAQKDLQNKLSNVARAQEDMIERSRTQLRREVEDVRRNLRKIVSQADRDKDLATAQRAIGRIKNRFSDPTWFPIVPPVETENMVEHGSDRELRQGDQVEIKGLNVNADVVDVSNDGTVDLQMGNARIELKKWQLRRIKDRKIHDPADSSPPAITLTNSNPGETTDELDIRGARVHEVADLVIQFVDNSSLQGLDTVRIIHGDGTGTVREAAREILANHSLVTAFNAAPQNLGGNGATIVDLT